MKNSKKKVKQNNSLQFIVQLSNFVIKKKGDGEFSFVRIGTVDGSWHIDFRDDTFKYSWIMMLAAEEKYHNILLSWIVVCYHTSMCAPDPEFLDDAIKMLDNLNKRTIKRTEDEQNVVKT